MKKHQKDKPSIIVEINGKEVCKAGICGNGTLNTSITLMNLETKKEGLLDNINCHILGLFDEEIYTWYYDDKKLKIGDEITIKVVKLEEIDEPIEVSSIDDCILNPPWWKFWKKNKTEF